MNIYLSCSFFVLSYLLTHFFFIVAQNSKLVDKPNDRTLHVNPTIRGGGLVFISLSLISVPFLCYFTNTSYSAWFALLFSGVLLASISFWDDLCNLSIKLRFLVHCVVAFTVALFLKPDKLDFILFSITNVYFITLFIFFMTLWAINHFNFMDGLDGFCASQAVFLLAAYFILFYVHQALVYQDFCLILLSGLTGFLIFNFPPAKLFMGDIGSASLGLFIFAIALIAQQKYQIPILYWFTLNSLFLFDATITLIRRIINKEQWSAPHKKHAYQRLKQYGMDTYKILLGQLLINGIIGYLVLGNLNQNMNILSVLFILILLSSFYSLIEKLYPMNK